MPALRLPSPNPDRKPVIWAMSISRLRQVFEEIVPQYTPFADIHIVDKGFEDALGALQEGLRSGTIDAVVAAGSNGAFLRRRSAMPVALVKVSGFDLLGALARAHRSAARVAVVMHQAIAVELEQFVSGFSLNVELHSYSTPLDAAELVRQLAAQGIGAIVGPGLVTDLAEAAGLTGVFLYSQDAVRQALDDAIELVRLGHLEVARRERLNTILRQLNEGVVAVDLEERIQTLNPAMERLLNVTSEEALGRRLSEVTPQLSLRRTLDDGGAELEQIQALGTRTLVVNRMPIHEQGVQTGAVLTVQDSAAIQRVDRSLRSGKKPRQFEARYRLEQLIGDSDAMTRMRALGHRYARTDATVLIIGESGTGKELLAQGIHNAGSRSRHPFVAINCAALPESLLESELFGFEEGAFTGSRRGGKPGLFELAHTGTIFLDEIGEMPLALQTRLLRVLQEHEVLRLGATEPTPVDVRVIAATHRQLPQRIADKLFRQDLYYRLNILHIALPPLRERREDLPSLAAFLLDRALKRSGSRRSPQQILQGLLPQISRYDWPGNVRELENVTERIAVYCSSIDDSSALNARELHALLPELQAPGAGVESAEPAGLKSVKRELEREMILKVLEETGGNREAASRRLGIGRSTLWRKLRER
jgi:propionate catabolism operon transcriptional regulator